MSGSGGVPRTDHGGWLPRGSVARTYRLLTGTADRAAGKRLRLSSIERTRLITASSGWTALGESASRPTERRPERAPPLSREGENSVGRGRRTQARAQRRGCPARPLTLIFLTTSLGRAPGWPLVRLRRGFMVIGKANTTTPARHAHRRVFSSSSASRRDARQGS